MIRRSLNPRFNAAVLAKIKFTTIRDTAWPVGVPIMLYNWSGAAYRSKQVDVAAVEVEKTGSIHITRREDGGMIYAGFIHQNFNLIDGTRIHQSEGFDTRADMDDWFRPLIKPGQTVTKILHLFHLI
jgi:hypothetical protein